MEEVLLGPAGPAGSEPDSFPPKIDEIPAPPKTGTQKSYDRIGIVPLADVLPHIAVGAPPNSKIHRREYLGISVKVCSLRLQCFAIRGIICSKCGLAGSFFALEKPHGHVAPHLNLYAVKDGKEILMTFDHIICKAAGGPNIIENAQTMCSPCNHSKGASIDEASYKKFKEQMIQSGRRIPKEAAANLTFAEANFGRTGENSLAKMFNQLNHGRRNMSALSIYVSDQLIDPFAC